MIYFELVKPILLLVQLVLQVDYQRPAIAVDCLTEEDYCSGFNMLVYSREFLLETGKRILTLPSTYRVPANVYTKLQSFDICSVSPTRRGSRGGKRNLSLSSISSDGLDKITSSNLKLGLCNTRSIMNKWDSTVDYMLQNQLDIFAITETWISSQNIHDHQLRDLPTGYSFHHIPRSSRRGGGVAIFYRTCLNPKFQPQFIAASFESLETLITIDSVCLRLVVLYRPPPSSKNGLTKAQFFEEFGNFLEQNASSSGKIIIVGDFNFDWSNSKNPDSTHMREMLDSFNLEQLVNEPTHISGHTLDWVVLRSDDNIASRTTISPPFSDHHCVNVILNMKKPPLPTKVISFRQYKKIDTDQFISDLEESDLIKKPAYSLEELIDQYNCTLTSLINKHAPLKSKTVTIRPATLWYTEKIKQLKSIQRRCEKRWRKYRLVVHREAYTDARKAVNAAIAEAKTAYFSDKIDECGNDQKALFKVIDEILHTKDQKPLPKYDSLQDLLNQFSDFFQKKIQTIRDNLDTEIINTDATAITSVLPLEESQPPGTLSSFEMLTEDDVSKIIMSSPSKSCSLDPIPTWLLKQLCHCLSPVITKIVNLSLQTGYLPKSMKLALVTPLIKKLCLDKEVMKNYRPVSNLPFVSKIIEKAFIKQLSSHMDIYNLHTPVQSAYRRGHSTETAILKIQNDILISLDSSKGVILILLDLSAAFDTIDHNILLSRLQSRIGITDTALQWVKSYLSDRSQVIHLDGVSSDSCLLLFGVPQGSVGGPQKFTIYSGPLHDIAKAHGLSIHMYADDTQIYLSFDLTPLSAEEAKSKLENCIADIRIWMRTNKLQLNEDKTELLVISPLRQSNKVKLDSIQVGDCPIQVSDVARNLGVVFDKHMTLKPQISSLVKSCNWQLRRIGQIRKFLSFQASEKLIHAFVTSRLDNGNSILYGLPDYLIGRLQQIHNTAARILTLTRKYDHISPILKKLHWLPVEKRIIYKILILTYRCLHESTPIYLADLLHPHQPSRSLRSSELSLLRVPKSRTKTYGDRAFQNAAPKLWNKLPLLIRQAKSFSCFKSQIKCYLSK